MTSAVTSAVPRSRREGVKPRAYPNPTRTDRFCGPPAAASSFRRKASETTPIIAMTSRLWPAPAAALVATLFAASCQEPSSGTETGGAGSVGTAGRGGTSAAGASGTSGAGGTAAGSGRGGVTGGSGASGGNASGGNASGGMAGSANGGTGGNSGGASGSSQRGGAAGGVTGGVGGSASGGAAGNASGGAAGGTSGGSTGGAAAGTGGSMPTQATYYVSPSGSDANPGSMSAPFLTVTKARDVVRTVSSNMTADIVVSLRGGNYPVTSTISFGPQDSGTNGHRDRLPGLSRRSARSERRNEGDRLDGVQRQRLQGRARALDEAPQSLRERRARVADEEDGHVPGRDRHVFGHVGTGELGLGQRQQQRRGQVQARPTCPPSPPTRMTSRS